MSSKPKLLTVLPPPLVYVVTLFAGVFLHSRLPLLVVPNSVRVGLLSSGVLLIVLGAAHMLPSLVLFFRARTSVIPHHLPSRLVTGGAYRWTRNPMYLGLTLAYLGVSLIIGSVWAVLLLLVPVLFVDRIIIPMEEANLAASLGQAYEEYRSHVRRWL